MMVAFSCSPGTDGEWIWETLETHRVGNLAELISFKFSERPLSQQINGEGELEKTLTISFGPYLHTNAHTSHNKYI